MRRYWIFNIGTAAFAPQEDWLADWRHHTAEMWFPPNKRPSGVRAGDRAVIHGTGGRGFFAVVEVISSAPEASTADKLEDRERWPFRLRYKLLLAIRADEMVTEDAVDNATRAEFAKGVSIVTEALNLVTEAGPILWKAGFPFWRRVGPSPFSPGGPRYQPEIFHTEPGEV